MNQEKLLSIKKLSNLPNHEFTKQPTKNELTEALKFFLKNQEKIIENQKAIQETLQTIPIETAKKTIDELILFLESTLIILTIIVILWNFFYKYFEKEDI